VGKVTETGAQDVVRCVCGKFQYNAPRVETGKAVRSTTTVHNGIKARQRALIIVRANARCELCGHQATKPSEELHVGHLLSVKDGIEAGLTEKDLNADDNLCCQCAQCNLGLGSETVPLKLAVGILMARLRRTREAK
jgi:hypothetical protein